MDDSTEEWRPIPGYEGRYEASSHGRIRSVSRHIRSSRRPYQMPAKIRKPRLDKRGYQIVNLPVGMAWYPKPVHQLVCAAFHGPAPQGKVCRHLNDDRLDCRPENLAWGTMWQNAIDVRRNGRTGDKRDWRGAMTPAEAAELATLEEAQAAATAYCHESMIARRRIQQRATARAKRLALSTPQAGAL